MLKVFVLYTLYIIQSLGAEMNHHGAKMNQHSAEMNQQGAEMS